MFFRKLTKFNICIILTLSMFLAQFSAPPLTAALSAPGADDAVYFNDAYLETLIRSELNKPEGVITAAEMAGITGLSVTSSYIQDLTGLEYAVNLRNLALPYSLIADLTPLAGLTSLTTLNLEGNQVVDISALAGLVNLQELWLQNNKIVSIEPLKNLTNLEKTTLGINPTVDFSPLANLTKLRELNIKGTQVTEISPLASLTNLEMLIISYNQVSDITPLANLKNLQSLHFNGTDVKDIAMLNSVLAELPNLNYIGMAYLQIGDISKLTALTSITYLAGLNLAGNGISDISYLSNFPNLNWLNLRDNEISSLTPLENLTRLQWLYLTDNVITDITPLVNNSMKGGIGQDDAVEIKENYLDITYGSKTLADIQKIIDAGALIYYEPQKTGPPPPPSYTAPTITNDLGSMAVVGEPVCFQVTTTANSDAGKQVRVKISLSDKGQKDKLKLEYKEAEGQYYPLTFNADGMTWFGPTEGLSLSNSAYDFRVTVNEAGNYGYTMNIVSLSDNSILAGTTGSVEVKPKSSDANLNAIKIDGVLIQGFKPEVLNYVYELPYGTTAIPRIEAEPAYPGAGVAVINPQTLPGPAAITVTAEDGSIRTYTVEFKPGAPPYTAPTITANLDGAVSASEETAYQVFLTANSDQGKRVRVETTFSDPAQAENITLAFKKVSDAVYAPLNSDPAGVFRCPEESLSDTAYDFSINFKKAGAYQFSVNVFSISDNKVLASFSGAVNVLSTDASLSALKVDGALIPGFASDVLSYVYELPHGTTAIPAIEAVPADPGAGAATTYPQTLPGTAAVIVTAEDGSARTYTVEFKLAAGQGDSGGGNGNGGGGSGDSGGGNGGSGSSNPPLGPGAASLASAITFSTSAVEGLKVTTAVVDEMKARHLLEQNKDAKTLVIPVSRISDQVNVLVPAGLFSDMADRELSLELRAAVGGTTVIYPLPAKAVKIPELARQLGVEPAEAVIKIVVAKPGPDEISAMGKFITENNLSMAAGPVEFRVEGTARDNKVEIKSFDSYISHILSISKPTDANTLAGIVLDADGKIQPVPARFITADGRLTAELKRKTNSIYAVAANKKTFDDLSDHWAKEEIDTLAARMIVSGMSENSYAPEEKVTRAQFASMLVRGLGLSGKTPNKPFRDITTGVWHAGAVGAAADAGIIKGYTDGTFRPDAYVTREEAAMMVMQALKSAGGAVSVTDAEADDLLAQFTDGMLISAWARQAAALAVKNGIISGRNKAVFSPADNITRAETAVILKKMLVKAELI